MRDTPLARLFSAWSGAELREEALYEWVVQEHLYRRFGKVYYYRNSYEVDAIAGSLKVEVKAGKAHRRYQKRHRARKGRRAPFLVEAPG